MPSPVTHLAAGYALFHAARPRFPELGRRWISFLFLGAVLTLSMLPDMDAVVGILRSDLGRYHNQFTHSAVMALGAGLLTGGAGWLCFRRGAGRWFLLGCAAYGLHVALDFVTIGRGVRLLWPWTDRRFLCPVPIFYGLHWSDGLLSPKHLVTLANEIPIAAMLVWWARRTRTTSPAHS